MRVPAAKVFISYRRADTGHLVDRLYGVLADRFASDRVFMDLDTIEAGVDFGQAIDEALSSCVVLLAVIGPSWLSSTDAEGNLKLTRFGGRCLLTTGSSAL